MLTARAIMNPPTTIAAEATVDTLAQILLDERIDGACIVDDAGQLRGIVTSMDLIYQEQPVHLPSFFVFLEALIPIGGTSADEMRKLAGATIAEIMTTEVISVTPETPLDEVATLMVEKHLTLLPVVEAGRLVGLIDKRAMLKAAFASASS